MHEAKNKKQKPTRLMTSNQHSPLEALVTATLIVLSILTLVWVSQRICHAMKLRAWYRAGNDYSTTELVPPHLGCEFKREELDSGRAHLKQSKVVICGLVRDKAHRIPLMRSNVKRLYSQFQDYRVLIVENDSSDGTREGLLEWAKEDPKVQILGCGVNAPKCELKLPKTMAHSTFTPRIAKMVALRNKYIDHMRTDPTLQDFDFAIVVDLDMIGYTYLNGFWHTGYLFSQNPNWDAVCSNGLQVNRGLLDDYMWYVDTYALRTQATWNMRKRALDDMSVINYPLRCSVGPRKLLSGFSGMTMYRFKSLASAQYQLLIDGYNEAVCEHVALSLQMNEIWIDPAWMFLILENDL